MTKVVIARSKSKPAKRKETSVTEKRVRDADGRARTLLIIDANSPTFGRDLEYVFGRNVAKARRENKRLTGSADGVVAKR